MYKRVIQQHQRGNFYTLFFAAKTVVVRKARMGVVGEKGMVSSGS